MNVTQATLTAVFVNLKSIYQDAFAAAPSSYQKIAMTVPSTGAYNDYRWLNNFPKMQRWVGKKSIKKLGENAYLVENEDFEATVQVTRNSIEDDQLGIYAPQASSAGFAAKQLPDELVYDALQKGFTAKCYDGKSFFATNHPVAKSGVSNLGTKKLSAASLAAVEASFGAGRTAMQKFTDDEGRPLGVNPNILLVPPALEATARIIATATTLKDNAPNPYKGTVEVVVEPRLTSDDAWYLLDTTKPVKPIIYQERKKPNFVQMTNPDSPNVFHEGVFLFGVEARAAAGFGFWQVAYASNGTVA